jgi:hypothetical protein
MSTIAKLMSRAELDITPFEKGLSAMEKSVDRTIKTVKTKTAVLSTVFTKLGVTAMAVGRMIAIGFGALLLTGLGVILFALMGIVSFVLHSITMAFNQSKGNTSKAVQDIKNGVLELKVAFANVFQPLITVALPYILMIINWLTRMLNLVSMFIAAWLGHKQVMQVVTGSVVTTTKEVEKLRKTTLGALAAFDQLDVLQSPELNMPDMSDSLAPGVVGTEMIDVTDEMLAKVQKIKDIIAQWFADPLGMAEKMLHGIWDYLLGKANEFLLWFNSLSTPWKILVVAIGLLVAGLLFLVLVFGIASLAISIWTGLVAIAGTVIAVLTSPITLVVLAILLLIGVIAAIIVWWPVLSAAATWAWEQIKMAWNEAVTWFQTTVIDPLIELFSPFWDYIGILANNAWVVVRYTWYLAKAWFITFVIEPIRLQFFTMWALVKTYASLAWEGIKSVFSTVGSWFSTYVGVPLRIVFDIVLNAIENKFKEVFTNIGLFVKFILNGIVDILNGMISNIVSTLNGLASLANTIGGDLPGWQEIPAVSAPQIPHLAEGAVLPPNNPFPAMVGDQKSGNNIEAPEDLIRQIVREETATVKADITISFAGTMAALVREMKPHIDKENVRVGNSLISSGVRS